MSDHFLAATRKGLFTFERKSKETWEIVRDDFLGDNVSMLLHDHRSGRLYAALEHGHFGVKLHRCEEAKRDWEECETPAYPPKPEDEVDNDMWGKPLDWSTAKIWALEPGGPDEAGVLWCGTLPGGLFKSQDDGGTWSIVDSLWFHPQRKSWMGGGFDLPGIHSICVDPCDAKTLRIGISTGGVWLTEDGGRSWRCEGTGLYAAYMPPERRHDPVMQDVHRLVQCPSAPAVLWIQHHNGIFRSQDGGITWSELENNPVSTFGFGAVVHPNDPDTAWFAPGLSDEKRIPVDGRFVVTRTRDGGKSFDVLTAGLPPGRAYDVVFRHGLDIDSTGDRLVLGSTTGNVWISEDQGDTWHNVARHLPPVYALRFSAV